MQELGQPDIVELSVETSVPSINMKLARMQHIDASSTKC